MEPRVNTVFVKNSEGKNIIRLVRKSNKIECYTYFDAIKYLSLIDIIDMTDGLEVLSVNRIDKANGLFIVKPQNEKSYLKCLAVLTAVFSEISPVKD